MLEDCEQLFFLWVRNPVASDVEYRDLLEDFCADMEGKEAKVNLLKAVDVKAAAHVLTHNTEKSKLSYQNFSDAIRVYIANLPE
jgi:hypothetical protein